ncbi:MAG: ribonuclease III [Heliobacteriaceae bacterium]|jgi:ribonuclease-3|nr:ribonuclease III [Heliobacteriaceae bacterium]
MIEEIFGISIENKELFAKALRHTSYTKEHEMDVLESYERLEFLGDAVLKLVISEILYKKYPEYQEGELTKIRSVVVSDNFLSKIACDIGLEQLVFLGTNEEKNGLRKLESICACVFEAVLGAYYTDGKFQELSVFMEELFTPYIEDIDKNFLKYNAKSVLQEYTQGLSKEIPVYEIIDETGPAHDKTFTVEVSYKGEAVAQGSGHSKKEAEQECALKACEKLGVLQCKK